MESTNADILRSPPWAGSLATRTKGGCRERMHARIRAASGSAAPAQISQGYAIELKRAWRRASKTEGGRANVRTISGEEVPGTASAAPAAIEEGRSTEATDVVPAHPRPDRRPAKRRDITHP